MANPNGWPDADKPGVPLIPEREMTAHRLRAAPTEGGRVEFSAVWQGGKWHHGTGSASPREAAAWDWQYVGPCLTPAEVEARVSRLKELVKEAFEEAARRYPNQAEAHIAFIQGALSWGIPTAEDMSWASDAIRKHEQETPND